MKMSFFEAAVTMRRHISQIVLGVAVLAVFSACSTLVPQPSVPAAVVPDPARVTEQIGDVTLTHPREWRLEGGPVPIGGVTPLAYLSNAALVVQPCRFVVETPDPNTCPPPLTELPVPGVLITIEPGLGRMAPASREFDFKTAEGSCLALGGNSEMSIVLASIVITGCIRGPGLERSQRQVRDFVNSIRFEN